MEFKEENFQRYTYNKPPKNNPYAPFIYSLILAFGVLLGYMVNTITAGKQTIGGKYNKIEDIINYISLKYVDTVNRHQLVDKTIDELLSNLDPHSVYIPAKDLKETNESLEGNFEGVGIEFSIVQDTITVVTPISGGPSEMVGIKSGDRIIKINDTVVAGIKIKEDDVKHKLRGVRNTKVKVSIMRSGRKNLLEFEITRAQIPLHSLDAGFMLNTETGYIRINNFSATTHKEFVAKTSELKNSGMKQMILDLRGNPGGYLQAATALADEFISDNKLLVYTQGQAFEKEEYKAHKAGMFEEGKLVVLLDESSASASEILSGAIQDWDRGTIVGRTSFGKGLVQEEYELKDHSAIRLTIARYYTPSGRSIQRPYDKGNAAYYNQIYERYMHGEFVSEDSIRNSDTTVYFTASGRKVFGGGGIRPDVFVPLDTTAENDYYFAARAFVPEFVYKYSSTHEALSGKFKTMEEFKKNFSVTDETLKEFFAYAKNAGLKYDDKKNAKLKNRISVSIKAFFAKQIWSSNGYFFVQSDDDRVITTALKTF